MSLLTKVALGGLAVALSLGTAVTVADAAGLGHGTHGRAANHGAAVSATARSETTTGEAHGDAVSAVAKANSGKADNDAANGGRISILATATTAVGAAKGQAISDAASARGAKMSGRSK